VGVFTRHIQAIKTIQMKKIYSTLFAALLLSLPVLANNVIVKGYVKYSNGTPAVNQVVYVSTDSVSTPSACMQGHQKFTNANGYYIDTLTCSSATIVKVRIDIPACGMMLTENPLVNTSTNVVERDFILSCSPQTSCHADFNFNIQQATAAFVSTSTAGPGATIVGFSWNFGDGTTSTLANPVHSYTASGNYAVKLVIESSAGCRDTIIKIFTIFNATGTCQAQFRDSMIQPNKFIFLSGGSTAAAGDSIVHRVWSYGDGTGNSGNYVNTDHIYQVSGTYTVCLKIVSARGCVDSFCKVITAVVSTPPPCHAGFAYYISAGGEVHFSNTSTSGSAAQYVWNFGTLATSSAANPVFTFPAGTYTVCLRMYSTTACMDSICKTITIPPPPPPTNCVAYFTYENLPFTNPAQRQVRFNSTPSSAGAGDSIISRKWMFGDGTSLTTGNVVSPVHSYSVAGSYTVCLTIKTRLNCEKTICKLVIVTQVNSPCVPHFTWQRTAPKQIAFNSSTSWVPVGDTIVQRKWNFGDGSPVLVGNVVSPVHNYIFNGVYTVSLKIITTNHCEQTFTIPVMLHDSTTLPPTADPIKILSIFPNPAFSQTQTVVWSLHNNVQAELAIYDVYGTKKWNMNKILYQGNNMTVIPTAMLIPGPYYFRVTTTYGVRSRAFFKRN
jgi:PKD repeat protein